MRRRRSAPRPIAPRVIRCRPRRSILPKRADAILFGAVGDPSCDGLERHLRPEQAILGLRKELALFANLRPAKLFPELADASALRPEVARAIDLVIVRETNGDVYFGEKGMRTTPNGRRQGYDVMSYDEDEVARIARVGFETAMARGRQALFGRQGQCARDLAAVARRGDRGRRRLSRRRGSATCMSTTPRCSWFAIRGSST